MVRKQLDWLTALGGASEVVLIEPQTEEEAWAALPFLKERKLLVLNLARLERSQIQRIVDCLSGCAQAIDGCALWVGEQTYLFAPSTVGIELSKTVSHRFLVVPPPKKQN